MQRKFGLINLHYWRHDYSKQKFTKKTLMDVKDFPAQITWKLEMQKIYTTVWFYAIAFEFFILWIL